MWTWGSARSGWREPRASRLGEGKRSGSGESPRVGGSRTRSHAAHGAAQRPDGRDEEEVGGDQRGQQLERQPHVVNAVCATTRKNKKTMRGNTRGGTREQAPHAHVVAEVRRARPREHDTAELRNTRTTE